jgi:ubiquitin-activating enzyme E1
MTGGEVSLRARSLRSLALPPSGQLFVMGHTAQARMQQSSILVVGLNGLGVEIAKNIILMGVKSVTLFDPTPATMADLGSNFYLRDVDVGTPRAAACLPRLAALNSYVTVSLLPSPAVTPAVVAQSDVVVAVSQSAAEAARLNDACRARKPAARFVLVEAAGAVGRVFSDFGPSWRVDDVNDSPPLAFGVAGAVLSTDGSTVTITAAEEARHGLEDGNAVLFRELVGGDALNETPEPLVIKSTSPFTFTVPAPPGFAAGAPYVRNGIATQVKQPAVVPFAPLRAMLRPMGSDGGPSADRDVVLTDFGKAARVDSLHALFDVLHAAGRAPAPGDEAAVGALVQAVGGARGGGATPAIEMPMLARLARAACGVLPPLLAALGGIAAQEVIKASSGKFMPLRQWLYLDAEEALPPADAPLVATETAPSGSRYDGQIAIFGRTFQAALSSQRYFLVGAGAIGCEVLKCWAMMGVGLGRAGGGVTVTDMDRIERSNLSRQFLFSNADIGRAKSGTAAGAAVAMNPEMAITALELRVGADSEGTFNDAFWNSLSGVCTALDNVDARMYVDGRAVHYGKPLLESGTLGTKGNTQVVVPGLTENYGASRDPPERSIPVCTLKNFPSAIEHTLQWARDFFEGEFKAIPDAANAYASGGTAFLEALARETSVRIVTLEKIKAALVIGRPSTLEDCVEWAVHRFADLFSNSIAQLLVAFPPNSTVAGGEPFWSGAKRCPTPLVFSPADATHLDFVAAASQLRGSLYNLKRTEAHTDAWLVATAAAVRIPIVEPRTGLKIATNDKELAEMRTAEAEAAGAGGEHDPDAIATAITASLPAHSALAGFRMNPLDFEKDDDLHIRLITAASNLRARNYRLEERDKHTSKGIAGKIIPAIATTTGMVAGLICLELYKLVSHAPFAAFRNGFANLAVPFITLSEPMPCARAALTLPPGSTYVPPGMTGQDVVTPSSDVPGARVWRWSLWDRVTVRGPMTLKALGEHLTAEFGVSMGTLTFGSAVLLGFGVKPSAKRERQGLGIPALIAAVTKARLPAHARTLELEVSALHPESGDEVEMPVLRYALSQEEVAAFCG